MIWGYHYFWKQPYTVGKYEENRSGLACERHGFLVGGFNPFENISQIGNLPQIGVKIKNV